MNLSELENLFENIQEIVNYMEESRYEKRRNRIFLGNGDKINFSVPKETIPHLLGINTNYLISTGLFKSKNAYEIMIEMLRKGAYNIYSSKTNIGTNFNLKEAFSPYILNKIEGFKNNIKINVDETLMVCKYSPTRTYILNDNSENYDYIIVKEYKDGKIGILGLVARDNYFVPMSNQLYNSREEAFKNLENYLKHQEVTVLTATNFFNVESDYEKMIYLNLQEKIIKLKNIKKYKSTFDFSIDMSNDYEHSIGKLNENKNSKFEDNNLIEIIVNCINNGELIDMSLFGDSSLSKIIEAFNDYLCSNGSNSSTSVIDSYTKLKKDLETFKNLLLESNEKSSKLEEENKKLNAEIEDLTTENSTLKENEAAIINILKPRM